MQGHGLKDLPHVFGDEEYKNMMQVLHATRDRYFTSIDNPLEPGLTELAMERWVGHQRGISQKIANRQRDEKEEEAEERRTRK